MSGTGPELSLREPALFPGLLPDAGRAFLIDGISPLPSLRVSCGIPSVTWEEHEIPPGTDLFAYLTRDDLNALALSRYAPGARIESVIAWCSTYRAGEHINRHTDKCGSIQLLLCLEAPPPGSGGELLLDLGGTSLRVCLQPGDALLFEASRIPHQTTPLVATAGTPAPKRSVVAVRYFVSGAA